MKSRTAHIPGLGTVELTTVTLGIIRHAYDIATEAEDKPDATAFANNIISGMLLTPSLTPEEVDQLPEETVSALAELAAEQSGLQDHYADISNTPPREKLFQAYQQWIHKLGERMVQAINQALAPIFDLSKQLAYQGQQFQESLSPITDTVAARLAEIGRTITIQNQQFQEALSQIASITIPQYTELNRSLLRLDQLIERQLTEAREASRLLGGPITEAGFWIPPSAPGGLLRELKSLTAEGNTTPYDVRSAIVVYYEADDFYALKAMVSGWSRNTYFHDRMHIIEDALDAHMAGKYTLSIPTLLPLVEGILTSIIGPRSRSEGMGRWVNDAFENMLGTFLREVCKDAVIAYITGYAIYRFVEHNTPEEYPKWLENNGLESKQTLQRHAILHGWQTDYDSKENSLRAFFMLDVLAHLAEPQVLRG